MSVEVRIPAMLRTHAGGERAVQVRPGLLVEVIAELAGRYPALGQQIVGDDADLHPFVNLYVNDEDVRYLAGLKTKIEEGDVVAILPAVAGGAPVADDLTGLIGNTPVVGIQALSPNPAVRIWAKLEGQNPTGSLKDRIARAMIEDAEASGVLTHERVLLEPTSGNTGISLAFFAQRRGYTLVCVMPETASDERRRIIEMYGAEVVLTPGDRGSNGAIEVAKQMAAKDPKFLMLYQYGNEANPRAHYETTGPEILRDVPDVTHFVAGLGTGGTITGVGRFFRDNKPGVEIIAAEPEQGDLVYGLRSLDEGFIPEILDPSMISRKIKVNSVDSVRWTQELLHKEGIFAGISSGATVHVARRVASKIESGDIVCLFADGGWKYLSTEIWRKPPEEGGRAVEYMPW